MWYLLSSFWLWFLLALALGLFVGWRVNRSEAGANWGGLVPWLAVLVIGALVAGAKLLPDRIGFWLDLGLLMLAVYVIGCLLSALLHALMGERAPVAAMAAPVMAAAAPAMARAAPTGPAVPAPSPAIATPLPPAQPAPAADLAVEPASAKPIAAPEAPEAAITGLSRPRGGKPDALTQIYGIDAETEAKLNGLGIYHVDQIAQLTPGQRRWLFRQLGYSGRFPGWWWRWRYDAEAILAGKAPGPAPGAALSIDSPAMSPGAAGAAPVMAAPLPHATPALAAATSAPTGAGEAGFAGKRPQGLPGPRGSKIDDLKRIRGIGKQNEGRLHGLGIWHFDQIAAWSAEEAQWVGGFLAFPGRIEREDWVGQAAILARGAETEFSKRADAGKVATSRDDADDDGQSNIAVIGKDQAPKPPKPS